MSAFTKFLNLFKWQPDLDGDEEFDIDKSLNENWDKIDTKLETYMTELTNDIEVFKNNTDTQVEEIGKQVNGLREISISPTQPTSNESIWIKKGKNLYNKKTAVPGYISIEDGNVALGGFNESSSDYIEIEKGKDYTLSVENWQGEAMWVAISLFDENKRFIERYDANDSKLTVSAIVTQNAKYIRTTNRYNNDSIKVMLEQNSIATDYEEYIDKEIYVKNDNGVFERFYSESEMNKQNYSTEEQKIGTWRDGKPLYRKTIVKENIGIGSNNVGWANANIDKVTKIEFTAHARGGDIISNNFNDGTTNMGIKAYVGNSAIDVWFNTNIECALVYFILEYTKTTD